jgi:hypothetical protein
MRVARASLLCPEDEDSLRSPCRLEEEPFLVQSKLEGKTDGIIRVR